MMTPAPFPPLNTASAADLAHFSQIVGDVNIFTYQSDMRRYCSDSRGFGHGRAIAVLRPADTAEVAAILRHAHAARLGIVPHGGNTGLVAGQLPDDSGRDLVVSLERLTRIRTIDAPGATLTAEAGVVLAKVQEAAQQAGLMFPLTLGAEGSCQIGGNIATNAGGTAVLAYGNTRNLVLGLEVVLPDGRIWNGLRGLRKDNTGYDMKQLFIGSEGTLGIITAATLALAAPPKASLTALVAVDSPSAALALYGSLRADLPAQLTAFELMPRLLYDLVLRHEGQTRDPFAQPTPWYVLLEAALPDEGRAEDCATLLANTIESGMVQDVILSQSRAQAAALWHPRHAVIEHQKREGAYVKFDISVPVHAVPELLAKGARLVTDLSPDARPLTFGHMGDGNIHFHILQPPQAQSADFLALYPRIDRELTGLVQDLGGSMAAEHGIGAEKAARMPDLRGKVELDMMRTLKAAFDPQGILNPGKLLLRA